MLRHELIRRLAVLIRPIALAVLVLASVAAGLRWHATDRFLSEARRTEGTVLTVAGDNRATIAFSPAAGQEARFTTNAGTVAQGGTVPVAYVATPGQPIDARLATPHALWAGMWTWVEVALGAALAAIYGRALIEDPLSVIAFKSSRFLDRRH